jgi:hypothetical protein
MDGRIGLVLCIVDATEELVRGGVLWVGSDDGGEQRCGIVDAAFLQGAEGRSVAAKRLFRGGDVGRGIMDCGAGKQTQSDCKDEGRHSGL